MLHRRFNFKLKELKIIRKEERGFKEGNSKTQAL
jgi:hypothetical protein